MNNYVKMGTKITASGEHEFRLQAVSEDDTIFLEHTALTFGNMVYVNRPSAPTLGRFLLLCYDEINIKTTFGIIHRIA